MRLPIYTVYVHIPQIFTTKFYVQKEIEYNFVSTQGSVNQSTLDGWEAYLEQFRDYIIKGTHFSNFAVQASHFSFSVQFNVGTVLLGYYDNVWKWR